MNSKKWPQFITYYFAVGFLILTFAGCAGNRLQVKPNASGENIHHSQLTRYDKNSTLNNKVFYVNPGDTIPIKLSMETDFMEFKQDQIDIIAKEKLYFMIEMPENMSTDELAKLNNFDARSFSMMNKKQRSDFLEEYMIYVSKDAVNWAPLFGSRSYRKVLGYKAGLLSFAILATATDGLEASLDIRTEK